MTTKVKPTTQTHNQDSFTPAPRPNPQGGYSPSASAGHPPRKLPKQGTSIKK